MPRLVEIGIDALFEALRDTEHRALTDLMVSLLRRNAYSLDDFLLGVHSKTDSLEDLRYDSGAATVSVALLLPILCGAEGSTSSGGYHLLMLSTGQHVCSLWG